METNRTIRAIDLTTEFDEFEELSVLSFGAGANPNLSMYRWLFDENPYDPPGGNMIFVMRDMDAGGKMIASDGLIPFDLKLGDRVVKAAHSVKSMTHPDYKRQGIFRTMTDNSLAQGKAAGVDVVLGFANKNSYPAYQKFGWTTLFPREVYVFPSDVSRKIAAKTKSMILGKIGNLFFRAGSDLKRAGLHASRRFTVQTFDRVPDEAVQLWEKYKDKYENLIVRDGTYLRWRYDRRPDRSYETLLLSGSEGPAGYLILRRSVANGKPMVCVAENFTDPENEEYIAALAETVIAYCRRHKSAYAVVCSGLYGKFDKVFRRYGFIPQKGQGTVVIAKVLNDSTDEKALAGAQHWHLTQGDGESELDL
ncbi:MAG: GNAT family N-acetyltransferase [Lachnospiraceae bacterium]|nr:GNAT family N-acetyltransferase [Lachnospiraceae bacterium]